MRRFDKIGTFVSLLSGRVGVGFLLFLGLTACATSQAPLDDAYYYPDKKAAVQTAQTTESTSPTSPASPTISTSSSGSTMEILSAQDTTITVRIKR